MDEALRKLGLDDHLCFAIYSAGIAINRAYKPLLDSLGITYPQYLVLQTLWEKDGLTVGAIGERLDLESATITPIAKKLEAAGLVRRERNPNDERQVLVNLTAQGRAFREKSTCIPKELLERSALSVDQLRDLNAKVRELRDALAGGEHKD